MQLAAAPENVDRRRWIALIVVCLGQLMIVVDSSIVNVALPSIQHSLHFSQANLTWVVNAYMITFGSLLLLAGRLGDLAGRKRIFLWGLVLFTAASAACGIAQDETVLIVARFIQGIGGAAASAVIMAIIVTEFPRPMDRTKAMSVYMLVVVSGGSIGLLAGGLLTQLLNWHWIFFVNLPIGVFTFVAGRALIVENEGLGLRQGVDWLGSTLVTVSMMGLTYTVLKAGDYGWGSAHTLGFGGVSLALLAAFFLAQARVRNPIMPLRILRIHTLMTSSAVRGILATGMFSSFFFGALYLERVRGFDPLQTGFAFLPMTIAVAIMSRGLAAWLMSRWGAKRLLLAGLVAVIVGLALLTQADTGTSYFPLVFVAFTIMGFGMGSSFLPLLTMAMADVPREDAGLGSAIVNLSMWLTAALGLAVFGAISTSHTKSLTAQGHSLASALTGGYHLAFGIGAAIVGVSLILAVTVLREPVAETEAALAPSAEPEDGEEPELQAA